MTSEFLTKLKAQKTKCFPSLMQVHTLYTGVGCPKLFNQFFPPFFGQKLDFKILTMLF